MQRLAVFLDGTWNDEGDRTNVRRLYDALAPAGVDGAPQPSTYIAGVGTKWHQRLSGGAVGNGLSENVISAYQWLVDRYDWAATPKDEIYIFGFSRGAYTARSLAGLIATCGLIRKGSPLSVNWLYERYRNRKDKAAPLWKLEHIRQTGERALVEDELKLLEHSVRVDIQMIGVWDTVGALGIPWTGMPIFGKQEFYFHNPNLSVVHKHAFQALAIDEHRGAFKPTLWTSFVPAPKAGEALAPPQAVLVERCEQRWFVGAHSDVGGGVVGPLPDRPLQWMQEKAQSLGLNFRSKIAASQDAMNAVKPSDSYGHFMFGVYRVLTLGSRLFRALGVNHNPVKTGFSYPINETIDGSVFLYCHANPEYAQKNLLQWAKSRGTSSLATIVGDQIAKLPGS